MSLVDVMIPLVGGILVLSNPRAMLKKDTLQTRWKPRSGRCAARAWR